MAEEKKVNGHRPVGLLHLLHPALKAARAVSLADLTFDVATLANSVVRLQAEAVDGAITAEMLGAQREGNGILIGDGRVLTIGYLIVEAGRVTLTTAQGRRVAAEVAGYDYESGFGLVHAPALTDVPPLAIGDSSTIRDLDPAVAVGFGGGENIVSTLMVSRRPFAGTWEYMLDDALFTSPPHPAWSGAALLDIRGQLIGVGSLYVNDALPGSNALPGNMFVPTALLDEALPYMASVRSTRPPRPWLGMFTAETMGHLVVSGVMPKAPADKAGVVAGDILVRVAGERVRTLRTLYQTVWRLGRAGVEVPMTFVRDGDAREAVLRSMNRYDFFKLPKTH